MATERRVIKKDSLGLLEVKVIVGEYREENKRDSVTDFLSWLETKIALEQRRELEEAEEEAEDPIVSIPESP